MVLNIGEDGVVTEFTDNSPSPVVTVTAGAAKAAVSVAKDGAAHEATLANNICSEQQG